MDALISVFTAFTPFEWILCVILLLSFLVQLFLFSGLQKTLCLREKTNKEHHPANDLPGISVIITSKNNSEELKKICLLCWNRIIQIMK